MTLSSSSVLIQGIGSYVPEKIVTNFDLEKIVDTSDEWIFTRSGIKERRFAAEGETTSDMATKAAERAIADAGLTPQDIDLIIVGTITPDMPFPSTACLVQKKLGLTNIPCFDMEAACSGFIYLLDVGRSMVGSGNYRHVLIIGAEKMSSILDWEDRTTCVLFGDGAGAAVLSATTESQAGVVDCLLGADGNNADLLCVPGGGSLTPPSAETISARQHYLKMNGKEIFKHAVRVMETSAIEILKKNNISPDEIAWVIPHQANMRIIENISNRVGIGLERFGNNLQKYGNTSAASIPIALDEVYRAGKLQSGDQILLVAFGAGLTWASSILKWK